MKEHSTNIQGLCDALNDMGIRTTIAGRQIAYPNESRISRTLEKTRRRALKEISRIFANAKWLSTKK